MDPRRSTTARRWSALASIVLVTGAVLVAVITSGAASAKSLAAPVNTSQPTISGNASVGQTLTGTNGTWSNSPTSYTYQWVRCGTDGGLPDGSNCAYIPGASTTGYVVSSADTGYRLRFRVTATNSDGQQTAASNPTSLISSAPIRTSDPVISGTPVQGQTLTTTSGGWSSSEPLTFHYQWVRCGADGGAADGSNCPAATGTVEGAAGQKYTLVAADVGHRMRVRVVASNSGGNSLAASNATAVVQSSAAAGAPQNTKEPSISGTAKQGQTLTANLGTWKGASPILLHYQWVRCGADGGAANGSNCPGVTGTSTGAAGLKYTVVAADVGHRMRVRVVATNSAGNSGVIASNATGVVQSAGPALPAGAIKLPNGKYSIPVTSVSLPARLVIDSIKFTPSVVRSRATTIQLRVHVSDTRGYYVRDALVFARSTPLVTTPGGEPKTGQDGWVTIIFRPKTNFPLKNGYSVQFFVRARKPGENVLAGVTNRRLIQVRTARG